MTWVLLLLFVFVALGLSRLRTETAVRYAIGVSAVALTAIRFF